MISLSRLPVGPRAPIDLLPTFNEPRMVMEIVLTRQRHHKGAFASTMWGGAIFYTPDITVPNPQWREVFDDSTAYRTFNPEGFLMGGGDGGSWLGISPDDRFLFHTVIGTQVGIPTEVTRGLVYVLDVRKLIASGSRPRCKIDTMEEVSYGGNERDCPELADVMPVRDETNGGPHWAAFDNFTRGRDGFFRETNQVERLAVANYFVQPLEFDGNHKVCIVNVDRRGKLSVDRAFRDRVTGEACLDFDREVWPHGAAGPARPHGVLFAADPHAIR